MQRKIFVSSGISGMETWRAAARDGIASLDHQPVMAEDFAASPATPQGACLAGVARSDVVIVLLGRRYGARQASGLSATEEEVREAKRLGLPILVFIAASDLEKDQEAFQRQLSEWQDGATFRKCASSSELQREIVRSLRHLESAPARQDVSAVVSENLRRVLPEQNPHLVQTTGPWLGFSWAPTTALTGFDEDRFFGALPDAIGDLLVAGPTRMLDSRPQVDHEAVGLLVSSRSIGRDEHALLGWVGIDGAVALGSELQRQGMQFEESMHVRPERARERLARMLAALGALLEQLDGSKSLQAGLAQSALACLGMAHFSDPRPSRTGGISMNMRGEETHVVPDQPERVSRFDLRADSPLCAKYIDRFRRSYERRRP